MEWIFTAYQADGETEILSACGIINAKDEKDAMRKAKIFVDKRPYIKDWSITPRGKL